MDKKVILKRVIVVVIASLIVSMILAYTITYAARHGDDPLEGVWINDEIGIRYGLSFKNGVFYTLVNDQSYSRMSYEILSTASNGDTITVIAALKDDSNDYRVSYDITGDTLVYDGLEYTRQ